MKIIINGKELEAKKEDTILSVALRNNIDIPSLCYHSDLNIGGSCRICVVEVNNKLVTACSTKVEEGMSIMTNSADAEKARRINLELLFSQHQEECNDCIWKENCKMLDLAKIYNVEINRFNDRKKHHPIYCFGSVMEYDSSKCIDCRNCVDMCKKQAVEFLELKEEGHSRAEVVPSEREDRECVYCGQCIIHCPAGAFEAVGEFEDIEKPFLNKNKKIVFQIAPAVRAAIGEEFGVPHGELSFNKLVTALRLLGADYVFDVSSGADITTIEESGEFLEKVKSKKLPLLTSCCPSWVRFVEFNYPEFIDNISSTRSPHIILGGVIKNYFTTKKNLKPEDVYVVSIMPCVSKKYEITRPQVLTNGLMPVDCVMTTREISRLLIKNNINLQDMEEGFLDCPLGSPTGSGVVYGTSGGVMQSAYYNLTGESLTFKKVKDGIMTAKVSVMNMDLNLAVVDGLQNAKEILEELKKDKEKYHFVEVMACKGGCIGGGGQIVPIDDAVRIKRRDGLCNASGKKEKIRAKDSKEIQKVYEEFLSDKEQIEKFCHTSYQKVNKCKIKKIKQPNINENKNNNT